MANHAYEALETCKSLEFHTVLDVGSGDGSHAAFFRSLDKKVTTLDLSNADICADYNELDLKDKFGLVWCSHVLEHQRNPGSFIEKMIGNTLDDGYIAITVPPLKNEIVGGHVTLWNAGLLLYQMILSGLDCSKAKVKTYGYNISVIVQKRMIELPELKYDFGDIEALSEYFPFDAKHGFDGKIRECNW